MRRIFSSFDLLAVHHAANLLAAEGIRTVLRNEILSSAAGELPPAECAIELWVPDDALAERGESLLRSPAPRHAGGPWRCAGCDERHEAQFLQCWRCGRSRGD